MLVGSSLVAAAITGCGSSADGEEGATESITKAAFIEKADAICEATDDAQRAAEGPFFKANRSKESGGPRELEEKYVVVVGLPPIQIAAEELGDLPVPNGDEETIDAIVSSLEEAVDEAREDPGSMLEKDSVGPFKRVFELAKDYGFKACARPI